MIGDEKNKIIGEAVEKLDAMGQESDIKASKWVKEIGKEEDHADAEKEAIQLEKLDKSRKFTKQGYYQTMVKIMKELFLNEAEIPSGWTWEAWEGRGGVGLTLWTSPPVKILYKAFEPCGEPLYDLAFCGKIVRMAADYMDEYLDKKDEEKIIVPKTGLILPTND
jgi:hypothetical protein